MVLEGLCEIILYLKAPSKIYPEKQSLSDPLNIKNIWSLYQPCGIKLPAPQITD